ncbi:MAG: permease-like cell division protein FtsX [Elusimicrobia bacterium]|nr:permease-like cell division protein FtsX [Elusimicrobiota bacterium]
MRSVSAKNLFVAALAGLLCGTAGETLLFLEAQVRRLERSLADEFRIVLFSAGEMKDAERAGVEALLRKLPGTDQARFISRDESLERLRRQDPELVRAVALLGENPLQSAWEVSLTPEAMGGAGEWAEKAARIPKVGDIRFKPMQVHAAVRCQFYARFLHLALSLLAFFWLAGAAAALWAALSWPEARGVLENLLPRLAMAGVGAAGGMGIVFLATLPLKSSPLAWAAPTEAAQGLLFVAGLFGSLFAWDWVHASHPHHAAHPH